MRDVDDSQIAISPTSPVHPEGGAAAAAAVTVAPLSTTYGRVLQATDVQGALQELSDALYNAAAVPPASSDLFVNSIRTNNQVDTRMVIPSANPPGGTAGEGPPLEVDGGWGADATATLSAGVGGIVSLIGGFSGFPNLDFPTPAQAGNAVVDGGSDQDIGDFNGRVDIGRTNATEVRIGRVGKPIIIFGVLTIGNITITSGSGSPEGAVTANPGSLFSDDNGGAGVTLYVKESGVATDTGWVAK
jgi:hypothetical protein